MTRAWAGGPRRGTCCRSPGDCAQTCTTLASCSSTSPYRGRPRRSHPSRIKHAMMRRTDSLRRSRRSISTSVTRAQTGEGDRYPPSFEGENVRWKLSDLPSQDVETLGDSWIAESLHHFGVRGSMTLNGRSGAPAVSITTMFELASTLSFPSVVLIGQIGTRWTSGRIFHAIFTKLAERAICYDSKSRAQCLS